jgi:hypothetical protein
LIKTAELVDAKCLRFAPHLIHETVGNLMIKQLIGQKINLKAPIIAWLMVFCLLQGVIVFTWAEPSHCISQISLSPIFDTVAWVNTQMPGRLIIRRGIDSTTLFLTMRDEFEKGTGHRAVYEYDPKTQSLRKVPDLKWDAVTSAVTECFSQSQQFPEKFKVNGEKLFFGNQEIPVKGAVLISSAYSPSGNTVAILSADGPRKRSGMPFLGGGQNSKGQHYHQLFSVSNGKPIRAAVKLQFTTEHQSYPACWSIDEMYIFYTSLLGDKLTIVETGLTNK